MATATDDKSMIPNVLFKLKRNQSVTCTSASALFFVIDRTSIVLPGSVTTSPSLLMCRPTYVGVAVDAATGHDGSAGRLLINSALIYSILIFLGGTAANTVSLPLRATFI